MKLEEIAFLNLVALARIDGLVSQSEHALLDRYRESLGLSSEFAEGVLQQKDLEVVDARVIKGKPGDRLHLLKMMVRVAYADGKITSRENRLLSRVARSFGIGRIALRGLFWEIEQELGIRRKLRLSQIAVLATIAAAILAVWFTYMYFSGETEQRLEQTRINIDELKGKLGLERAEAEAALKRVRESQADLTKNETALSDRLDEIEQKNAVERSALKTALTEEQKNQQALMAEEVKHLKAELARVRTLNTIFKEIEKEYGGSILLLFTTYDLVLNKDRVTRGSMGSGFFVSSTGHILTNKHVVQPWKFSADEIMLMDNGYTVDKASMLIAAWPAGAEVKTAAGLLNIDTAYTTVKKNLAIEKTTPDTFEIKAGMLESGMIYRGEFHTFNEGDLAVLKASPPSTVKALRLVEAADNLEKLDPVMVLGFPTGINILETTRAETSPSLGEVRKIEKSIMVTAPIVPGNSGGPLMDIRGSVVGVASGSYGEATLGSCIPSQYILPLLPATSELLKDVATHETAKAYRAALDDLRLAEQRCSDDKERKVIGEMRARFLKIKDQMLEKAQQVGDNAARKKAYQEIMDRFGPNWAKETFDLFRELE